MKPLLIYCYDAYCGWCYAFSPIILEIQDRFQNDFDFEVLSGGMILPATPRPISVIADFMLSRSAEIEATTGVNFGADFLWHLKNPELSDWYPDSLKPAVALAIIKTDFPEKQLAFATDLGYALNAEGRDLCDDEAYRHLLVDYEIPEEHFYKNLRNQDFIKLAQQDFETVKQLRISGYPALLVQANEKKIIRLFEGYRTFEETENVLLELLKTIK